jgi:hypothetical protein
MRRMRAATATLAIACLVISTSSAAQNLLEDPDFDLPPVGNGWTATGTGSLLHDLGFGQPAPSVELLSEGSESLALSQCRPVAGDEIYDIDARTFTGIATGASLNEVRVRWYALEGCTNEIDSLPIDTEVYPPGELLHRYRHHVAPPINAQSASVELAVYANGSPSIQVWFDAIYLPEPEAGELAAAALGALVVRRCRP